MRQAGGRARDEFSPRRQGCRGSKGGCRGPNRRRARRQADRRLTLRWPALTQSWPLVRGLDFSNRWTLERQRIGERLARSALIICVVTRTLHRLSRRSYKIGGFSSPGTRPRPRPRPPTPNEIGANAGDQAAPKCPVCADNGGCWVADLLTRQIARLAMLNLLMILVQPEVILRAAAY